MSLNIVVCIKQVPDSAQIRVHPVTNTIMRQGVPTIVNPYDLFSLETALRLRDEHGGTVSVLTMGPPMAEDSLRKCMAIGADRAFLLTDRFFAGSDTLATSYALAAAITKIGIGRPIDMVFCGKQTIDGDTAQVGPGIARRLGLQQLTYVDSVESVDLRNRQILVRRRAEGGVQVLKTALPCLVTMLEGSCTIRRGSMADSFKAARSEIVTWNAQQAGIEDIAQCGLKGSPTVVKKVFAPKPRAEKAVLIDTSSRDPSEIATSVINTIFAAQPKLQEDLLKQHAGR